MSEMSDKICILETGFLGAGFAFLLEDDDP